MISYSTHQCETVPDGPEIVLSIDLEKYPSIRNQQLGFKRKALDTLLGEYGADEAVRRLERINAWMQRANLLNQYGVVLTPVLSKYLAGPGDLDDLLTALERYQSETRAGRFRLDNPIQRDLEFRRFLVEFTRERMPTPTEELYSEFLALDRLPPPRPSEFALTDEQTLAARRVAHEAVSFLEFLREFKAWTSRSVVVVGNDRYGRLWFVEPIEKYLLDDGFEVRYDRVVSLLANRLSTPAAFPAEFVRRMSADMPHIVVADGASAAKNPGSTKISKALRSYANWFAAFNDVRAEGDGAKYQHESSIPIEFFPELMKWHEFVVRRAEMAVRISPGETYHVTTWSPDLSPVAEFGDLAPVPTRHVVFGDDRPQVVLANPMLYGIDHDDLPEELRPVRPYFFNDPEKRVAEKIVYGFGRHGFESRIEGPTTAQYVAAAQQVVRREVGRLLEVKRTEERGG